MGYWKVVNRVIREADILIEVLDARFPELSRNREIEEKAESRRKMLILALNKCDLIKQNGQESKPDGGQFASVYVSAKERLSIGRLRRRVMGCAKRLIKRTNKERVVVGVLGYPNTGKSSVINALAGKHKAGTSSTSGFTKGVQLVKLSNKIYLLDTPGVFPFGEKDEVKRAIIGAKDYSKVKDAEGIVLILIGRLPGKIEGFYGLDVCDDAYSALEAIAYKKNLIKKGGLPDLDRAARMILRHWQEGRM